MKFLRYFEYAVMMPKKLKKIYDKLNAQDRNFNSLSTLLSAQMAAHKDNLDVILELSRAFISPKIIHNTENALKYLSLVRPFRHSSFKFVRIGGTADGGYCLLCPPPH